MLPVRTILIMTIGLISIFCSATLVRAQSADSLSWRQYENLRMDDAAPEILSMTLGSGVGLFYARNYSHGAIYLIAETATWVWISNSLRHDSPDDLKFQLPLILFERLGQLIDTQQSVSSVNKDLRVGLSLGIVPETNSTSLTFRLFR